MSHLLSFLEQYSHLQQLQQQADQYRMQLRRHRVQHRRKMKALRSSYRQRLRDKGSVIHSLEEAIAQQQTPSPDNDSKDICVALFFLYIFYNSDRKGGTYGTLSTINILSFRMLGLTFYTAKTEFEENISNLVPCNPLIGNARSF